MNPYKDTDKAGRTLSLMALAGLGALAALAAIPSATLAEAEPTGTRPCRHVRIGTKAHGHDRKKRHKNAIAKASRKRNR